MEPASSRDADRLEADIASHAVRWEIGVYRVLAVLIALAAVMIVCISPWIGADLAVPEIGLCGVSVAYFATSAALLNRGFTVAHMRWISATIEVGFPSIAILLAVYVKGAAWAMSSPMILIYPVAIAACSIRLRSRLTLYATAVAVVQWLAVYYLAIDPRLDESVIAAVPGLDAWAAWERAFWLALIGGVTTFATHQTRRATLDNLLQGEQRQWLQQQFGRFVSRDVVDAVIKGNVRPGHAEKRYATVLFCDLRDFTAMCQHEAPEAVVELLNAFYERACELIDARGGHVNKFLGDGVLALFGAPDPSPDHAMAACEAARKLAMAAYDLRQRGGIWTRLRIGIGIDTGDVVVGTMGGRDRLDYTAIGSTVNRAARLQALSDLDNPIVVSDECARELTPEQATSLDLQPLGEVSIKGFATQTRVHRLTGG